MRLRRLSSFLLILRTKMSSITGFLVLALTTCSAFSPGTRYSGLGVRPAATASTRVTAGQRAQAAEELNGDRKHSVARPFDMGDEAHWWECDDPGQPIDDPSLICFEVSAGAGVVTATRRVTLWRCGDGCGWRSSDGPARARSRRRPNGWDLPRARTSAPMGSSRADTRPPAVRAPAPGCIALLSVPPATLKIEAMRADHEDSY